MPRLKESKTHHLFVQALDNVGANHTAGRHLRPKSNKFAFKGLKGPKHAQAKGSITGKYFIQYDTGMTDAAGRISPMSMYGRRRPSRSSANALRESFLRREGLSSTSAGRRNFNEAFARAAKQTRNKRIVAGAGVAAVAAGGGYYYWRRHKSGKRVRVRKGKRK